VKTLRLLIENIHAVTQDAMIETITNNSRDVIHNTLFLAFPGTHVDARQFISNAIAQGASAVLYENSDGFVYSHDSIPCVGIADLKERQAEIAARFYDLPGKKVPVIGVTGTNGKTSITQFIAQLLHVPKNIDNTGVIGTLGYGFHQALTKLSNTTPDGLQLQKALRELIDAGATNIAMEVSSHGLAEHRVDHIDFHTAVFTNLTQDHLDFHGTMENYRAAKELLFQKPGLKNVVINIDDETGRYFAEKYSSSLNVITYSKNNTSASIFVRTKKNTPDGFDLSVQTPTAIVDFHLPLIGEFNIENILAVIGVLTVFAAPINLSALLPVPGRMELIKRPHSPYVIIDYAHTPDALEKALQSVRLHCTGKLFCIFGCGGNRDKTKRPRMGAIAEKYADVVVITNDNPRDEDPDIIAAEVAAGMKGAHEIVLDRVDAIQQTLKKANENDWILLAGKGHETDQIIAGKTLYHSDAACVLACKAFSVS
jgi:UDP-N-acetylmuramoyl-L-alanyl-D-glutamate--2,6-diaminopimelate ligase